MNGRRGFKVLGVAPVVALALMVAGLATAQAAEFLIEEGGVKKTFTAHGIAMETVAGSIGETELLQAAGVKLFCQNGEPTGTLLLGGKVHLQILFSGCSVLEAKACIVYETELDHKMKTPTGYFNIEGLGQILLHEGAHYILIEGAPLGRVWFGGAEKGCTLPLSMEVSGSYALRVPGILAPEIFQEFKTITTTEEASLKKLFAGLGLMFGGEAAHFKAGTVGSLFFNGALNGKKWGAH